MRTIEIAVYRFNELKRDAQDEAIAEERHDLIVDLDYVLDDWKEKLKNLGYGKVDIWYSGWRMRQRFRSMRSGRVCERCLFK